jgi:hypothetical protein
MLIFTAVWALSIAAAILIITPAILNMEVYPEGQAKSTFAQDAIFSLVVAVLISFSLRIHRLVGALLEHMRLPDGVRVEDMGAFELSGKAQATRVYAVHDARS